MKKWEIETGGTLGEGSESSPCIYPRSEDAREGTIVEQFETPENDSNPYEDFAGDNADSK